MERKLSQTEKNFQSRNLIKTRTLGLLKQNSRKTSWTGKKFGSTDENLSVPLFFLTVVSTFAGDAMKFVSPDKTSTLVVDKSGRRDIIELKSGKRVHPLFYDDLDSIFKPKIAEAFNASLNKIGKILLPTFTSASWTSPDEVEIKGESSVVINDDKGDEFTFTALVLNSGSVRNLTVVPAK